MRTRRKESRPSCSEGRRVDPARAVLLVGLAGSTWAAWSWGILNAWFLLPPVLALTVFALGCSLRGLRSALEREEKTRESLMEEIRDMTGNSERRIQELRTLFESSLTISRSAGTETLTRSLAEDARQMVGAASASLFLVDGDRVTSVTRAGDGGTEFRIAAGEVVPDGGIARRLLESGAPVVVSDTERDNSLGQAPEVPRHGMKSLIALPLRSEEHTFGGILLGAGEPDFFTGEEVRILTILGNLASTALEKLRIGRELGRRVEEIEDEKSALRSAARLRDRLIGAWARELGEPLAMIDRMGDVLGGAGDTSAGNLRRAVAKAVQEEAERARRIGREMERLGQARADSAETEWSNEPVGDLVREVMVSMTNSSIRRRILVKTQADTFGPAVVCDRSLLKDALGLLFDYLVTENPEDGTLSVEWEKHPGSASIVLSVECSERVMETMYRAFRGETPSPGLALARWVFHHHGGSLDVEPQLRPGVRVVGSLPVGRSVRPLSGDVLRSLAAGEPPARILQTMMSLVAHVAGTRRAVLRLRDSDAGDLFLQAGTDLDETEAQQPDETSDSRLAAPLEWNGETLGVLEIDEKLDGTGFTEPDVHLVRHLASLLARSLVREDNVRRFENDLLETLSLMASVAGRSTGEAVESRSCAVAGTESAEKETLPC